MTGSSATPSPIPFNFQIVDDPNSLQNGVTSMNQLGKITGIYGGGQGSNVWRSYTSQRPYSKFRPLNYPGAQDTIATGLSSNRIEVGYVIDPPNQSGTYGFMHTRGLWSLFADPAEGTGSNAVTELLGINDSQNAVGYYLNNYGLKRAFELEIPTLQYNDISPPGSTEAAGTNINGKGEIAGWEVVNGVAEGFFLQTGTYYPFSYPGAQQTYALGLNWSDQVVGNYIDAFGMSHGFLLTGPTRGGGAQTWQNIDAPNAAGGTWVTGINNHHAICGYYIDASGNQHGFVAVPGQ